MSGGVDRRAEYDVSGANSRIKLRAGRSAFALDHHKTISSDPMPMNPRASVRSLIAMLPRSVLYEAFYQSARALDVRSYQINGSEGSFFGPVYDQSVSRHYLDTGVWSDNIVSLLRRFFGSSGGTLYDVGANIGLVSVPIARDPNVRVVAFEPDANNCDLLRANVAVARVAVEVVDAAVASHEGTQQFARSGHNSGDHRLSAEGKISVRTVRLDDFPPGPGAFAVKIDTQGAEPLIFEGGETVLAQAGLIVAEFWPWGMRRMNLTPEGMLRFAAQHFETGLALHHGEVAGQLVPIETVLDQLKAVVAAGGEHDFVDLVLSR
jgi:FkbM family methyltransferase